MDKSDESYRRCEVCGMPVKINREKFTGKMDMSTESDTITSDSYDWPNGSSSRTVYTPIIKSGCWFCGNSIRPRLRKKI